MVENISSIDPGSIAITAITLYKGWYPGEPKNIADTDKIRGDVALESVSMARRLGYQVVIADGPSSPAFKDSLASLGVQVLQKDGEQRAVGGRQTIERAAALDGVRVILRTELEKLTSLIEDGCIPSIVQPILGGKADIALPKRNEGLYRATYPDYMYDSETKGRRIFNYLLHRAGLLAKDQTREFLFGVIGLSNNPHIVSLFMKKYAFLGGKVGSWKYVQPEEWSDIQLFPIMGALSLGYKVKGVEIPFRYPIEQKENEELNREIFAVKRKEQRMDLVSGAVHYLRMISSDPKVRAKCKLVPLD